MARKAPMTTYFLGLGSNLGCPAENLARALALLRAAGLEVVRASSVYRTEPVGGPVQPWFLNQVVEVRAALDPPAMLEVVRSLEDAMKRVRAVPRGPRTIDIDILLAGELVVDTEDLTIPHPRMALRRFVLVPLAELAPEAVHPVLKMTVAEILRTVEDRSAVLKTE